MTLIGNQEFDEFMEFLSYEPMVAFDLETTGLRWYDDHRLCGVAVGADGYWFYVPFRHATGTNVDIDRLPILLSTLESKTLITWNGKFDVEMAVKDGYRFQRQPRHTCPIVEDVMLAAHVFNENEGRYGLKRLADLYLGEGSSKDAKELATYIKDNFKSDIKEASRYGKSNDDVWKAAIHKAPSEMVEAYACADVELTWRMRDWYVPQITDVGLDTLYYDKCIYLQEFILMELRGARIDIERMDSLKSSAEDRMAELKGEILDLSDDQIENPGSSHQVNKFFGRGHTRKEDLDRDEQLKIHPVGGRLREYRSADKLLTSFLYPYEYWKSNDDTIHPSFNLIGAYTGRLSCYNPNLMAVPRASEDERLWVTRVKEIVIPRDGYILGEFDMSQAELRIASHYGALAMADNPRLAARPIMCAMTYDEDNHITLYDEPRSANWWRRELPEALLLSPMGAILMSGNDLHQETADRIGTDRSTAKRINFSAVFGIGAQKYSDTYGIPLETARSDLQNWHAQFPEFRALLQQKDAEAMRQGYIQLESGLARRYKTGANTYAASSNWVQGTVAEVMRYVLMDIGPVLRDMGAHVLLQIHDSFIIEIPEGLEREVKRVIQNAFGSFRFAPRLVSDGKAGYRWSELQKITDE